MWLPIAVGVLTFEFVMDLNLLLLKFRCRTQYLGETNIHCWEGSFKKTQKTLKALERTRAIFATRRDPAMRASHHEFTAENSTKGKLWLRPPGYPKILKASKGRRRR